MAAENKICVMSFYACLILGRDFGRQKPLPLGYLLPGYTSVTVKGLKRCDDLFLLVKIIPKLVTVKTKINPAFGYPGYATVYRNA